MGLLNCFTNQRKFSYSSSYSFFDFGGIRRIVASFTKETISLLQVNISDVSKCILLVFITKNVPFMIVFALLSSTHSADYENTRLKILTERYERLG